MKNCKKLICILLTLALLSALMLPVFATDGGYTITNPYQNIQWDTVNTYKTALHTHTNASDGTPTLKESLQRHMEAGFQMVATTDHGTVNYTWQTANPNKLIYGALSAVGKSEGELVYLGTEGTFDNGVTYTCQVDGNGTEYVVTQNGDKLMRIPYGIENNAVSVNAHVNSWFTDYCDNSITTYEDAVKGVEKAGGICIINHPGEYTKARYELHSEDAYNESDASYAYYINKFATLLKSDSCLGIDMNSKGDNRTRFDRKLWDILLTRFADNGQNVYGFCSSDAHQLKVIDTGYTLILAKEQTAQAAQAALTNGEFFGASHCLGNYDELIQIAAGLKEFYGETELYTQVIGTAQAMLERVQAIEAGEMDADEDISITYEVLDGNGYCTAETQPQITGIEVDDAADTITVHTEDALLVRFISNGKLLTTVKADNAVINLHDFADELGNYVRAEVFGEGGMLYTQAFLLNASQNAGTHDVVSGAYINLGVLDFLLAEFRNLYEIIVRFIGARLS